MGKLVAGSEAAKDLGIYLGQLYGWVKAGKVKNHKPDGKYVTPDGKGLIVDIDEAREAWMASKKKGPRAPREKTSKRVRNEDGTLEPATKTRKLKTGTIIAYENGKELSSGKISGPRYTVAQVIGSGDRLTWLDDGDHRRAYDGTVIDHMFFGTDRISTMLAKGVVHIERPHALLGMVLFQYITEGKIELAQSLEDWLIANGVEVQVPEPMDLEEEPEPEPIRGAPVLIAEESE